MYNKISRKGKLPSADQGSEKMNACLFVENPLTQISDTDYLYQNVPNDFEAKIEVDESGLVVDYPALFVRTAVLRT